MDFKGYDIAKDGTIKKGGKLIATSRIYVDGNWLNGIDIANQLFNTPKKQPEAKQIVKSLKHGLIGFKHSEHSKMLMSSKGRKVVIEGISYQNIKTAATQLNVSRGTIYRRLKSEDTKKPTRFE